MKKNRVTAQTVCDYLGVSRQTFATLIERGVFERQSPATGYDLKLCTRAAYAFAQRRAAGRGEAGESAVLSSARARSANAVAERNELQNKVVRGEYVPLVQVMDQVALLFVAMRETALGIPGKIADALTPHSPKDREEIFSVIDYEIRQMLDALSVTEVTGASAVDAPVLAEDVADA